MNYGHYELPALSEYTVTETIYPDPDAKEQISISDWVKRENIAYDVAWGQKQLLIHAPYPTDVELTFEDVSTGWTYVFENDHIVVV